MSDQTPNKTNQRSRAVRLFAYCVNKLWLLLASIIIFAALIHIALGLLLPKIDHYNQDIIDWVKQNYGLTIEISEISAEWDIQGPSLSLKGFKIKSVDGAYDLLNVQKVSVDVDLLASLFDQRVSTQDITINGADIQFYISSELGVALTNNSSANVLENIGLESISQELFDVLFGQRRITIVNSNLSLFTLSGTEFEYLIDELEVIKFDSIHQLFGRLSYAGGGEVTLVSEVYGDPTAEGSYSNVYLEGSQIDIAKLPWVNLASQYTPQHGNLSWKFWGTWKKKHWQNAKAIIELDNATLGQQPLQQNQLQTMISWEHEKVESGYMAIHGLQFKVGDSAQTSADSLIHFSRIKGKRFDWEIFVNSLSSTAITDYLQSVLQKNDQLSLFIENTNIQTTIDNLHISLAKVDKQWQPLAFELDFSELALTSYESIPALATINGKINYKDSAGEVMINATDAELIMPQLFRHSIQASSLNATANWSFDEQQQLLLNIHDLQLTNKDFELVASAAFQQMDGQPILNLYTELHDASVANKSLYLPIGVMTDELVSYLDSSIKTGTLRLAKSIVRGPITHFPFDTLDGVFVAFGEVIGASYKYLPDWPLADGLDANLMFVGSMMDITASAGSSLENKVSFARAFSKDLSNTDAMLELSLNANSVDNSGREFLKQTPLDFLYDAIKEIDYVGELNTQLDIQINLDQPDQLTLVGQVEFPTNDSEIKTSIVDAKIISGKLKFNEKGLLASQLKADYFGKTLDLLVQSGLTEKEPVLSIDIKGQLPVEGITHFIGERWKPFFNGESSFSSLIQFAPSDSPDITRVLFQTDFKGMHLDFPGEFGKASSQVSETYLTLDIGETSTGEISWGNVSGDWYWKESKLAQIQSNSANSDENETTEITKTEIKPRQATNSSATQNNGRSIQDNQKATDNAQLEYGGDFFINKKKSFNHKLTPGLRVSGSLKLVTLDDWLDFISKVTAPVKGSTENGFDLVFNQVDLNLEKLETGITSIESVELKLNKLKSRPWQIAVSNPQVEGMFTFNEYSPWLVDIKRANLDIISLEHTGELASVEFSPLQLNDMDFRCLECFFNQINYGEILAEVRKMDKGISILGQMNKSEEHKISVSALWFETEDFNQETQVLLELNSENIGKFLKQWELDATVEDSSGRVIANAWWGSAPWLMDYKSLDGDFQLALGKGYLSEISDGQGRLFSLFNLQSILRKLTFDFKDVYKKGFFYDSINGTIRMRDGVVSTENVEIEGNVADVKLYGKTDLRQETIDQTAVITPHLTSSFPVLAAWAVEPTTGLLVFLLDKIMEPAVEVATRLDYSIAGTFDEVVVEEIKRSKKKIKVEYTSEQVPEQQNHEPIKPGEEPPKPIDNNSLEPAQVLLDNSSKQNNSDSASEKQSIVDSAVTEVVKPQEQKDNQTAKEKVLIKNKKLKNQNKSKSQEPDPS